MSKLTRKDILHVAELARLRISEGDIEKRLREMNEIVGYFHSLQKVPTEGIDLTSQVEAAGEGQGTPMAEDEPQTSLSPQAALSNAPARQDSFFQVPRVIEDGD